MVKDQDSVTKGKAMGDNVDFIATDIKSLFDGVDFDRSEEAQRRVWERVASEMRSDPHEADAIELDDSMLEFLSAAGDVNAISKDNRR